MLYLYVSIIQYNKYLLLLAFSPCKKFFLMTNRWFSERYQKAGGWPECLRKVNLWEKFGIYYSIRDFLHIEAI